MKQILRLFLTAAFFAPLLLCSGCSLFSLFRPSSSSSPQEPALSRPAVSQQTISAAPSPVQAELRYCQQLLSGDELDLYFRVLEAVRNAEPSIVETNFDRDVLSRMEKDYESDPHRAGLHMERGANGRDWSRFPNLMNQLTRFRSPDRADDA